MVGVLVTGIPASGKSTLAAYLSKELRLPMMSKDKIKELLFDTVGFRSREEKVALGMGSMEIMYYFAEQMMRLGSPFLLENNFEAVSMPGIEELFRRYRYRAVTVLLTGEVQVLYQRFLERQKDPGRHRGHVVSTCYPERPGGKELEPQLSLEQYCGGIKARGMEDFSLGERILVDTTDFSAVDYAGIAGKLRKMLH